MTETESPSAPLPLAEQPLDQALLVVLRQSKDATLSAQEIAQTIVPDGDWHALLTPLRRAAIALAQAGRLVIYRKGRVVDPSDFRGVFRLGLPRHD